MQTQTDSSRPRPDPARAVRPRRAASSGGVRRDHARTTSTTPTSTSSISRTEGWSLEEGIVKSGSFNIDQGVGVRAIAGEKTAFAYSDEISLPALEDAAGATRAIARLGRQRAGGRRCARVRRAACTSRSIRSPRSSDAEKVRLLERLERLCRARDPRVVQVMATLAGDYEVVLVARADGVHRGRRAPARAPLAAGDRRAERSARAGQLRAAVARSDYALLHRGDDSRTMPRTAVDQALVNLESRPAPAGTMTVVLGPGWPGVLLHEAIGHGLEGDFNRKGSSAFSGRIGERVASRGVTVVDDGTHPEPARLAQRRRRGQPDAVHDAHRGRRAARLHPGQHERAPDEDAGHRQRPPRVLSRTR